MMKDRSFLPLALLALVCAAGFALPACGAQESTTETAESQSASASGDTDDGSLVAKIGDINITEAELESEAAEDLKRIESQIYDVKRRVLDRLVERKLLENAASKAGKTVDQLVQDEVEAKLAAVTDDDVKKFYDENKERVRGEYEQVKGQIRQFLEARARNTELQQFTKNLKKETPVVVYLEAPKVEVAIGDAPVRGNPDAPVTIVEFSDYQCPYCKRSQAVMKQIKEKYQDKVRLVFKDFPLAFHNRAMPAAVASRCAGEQGKYWEFHDKLFSSASLEDDDFKKFAKELGIDVDAFDACVGSKKYESAVSADMSQGQSAGVSGTPAFFINGRFLSGAQPLEAFSEIIDDELNKAGAS